MLISNSFYIKNVRIKKLTDFICQSVFLLKKRTFDFAKSGVHCSSSQAKLSVRSTVISFETVRRPDAELKCRIFPP